jgi:hypothetical protein
VTEIEDRYVEKARELVLEKFPEMVGAKPSVGEKRSGLALGKGPGRSSNSSAGSERRARSLGRYVLTFEKDVPLPGGHTLKRLVRVTMDESGEVVKLTSSK